MYSINVKRFGDRGEERGERGEEKQLTTISNNTFVLKLRIPSTLFYAYVYKSL